MSVGQHKYPVPGYRYNLGDVALQLAKGEGRNRLAYGLRIRIARLGNAMPGC
jgi:hypothetical protein